MSSYLYFISVFYFKGFGNMCIFNLMRKNALNILIFCLAFLPTKQSLCMENVLEVNVVPLVKQNTNIVSQYVGYITPIKEVELVPNVSGYIDEVWAEGGIDVKQGDNLVLIDQREYKAQLDAAKATTAQAKATYDNAKTYFERVKKAGSKAFSKAAFDDAKAKFLSASANLKQAKAEEQKANVMFDYTVLQAPIDGVIGNVNLTKGNYVAPNSPALLSIIQFNPIRVEFGISDKEYINEKQKNKSGNLFNNDEIKLRLANGKIYDFNGKFQFTDNQINKLTNSISVFADFENPDKILTANSYVDVLIYKKMKDIYLIRQNYAFFEDDGIFVYIVKNNKLAKTKLKIAGYFEDSYVVENNFAKDEFLVIDKIGKISPNTTIKTNVVGSTSEKK